MKAKKVTAKKVLACVILGPLLIPTAAMLLMCYPIIWAVRQLDNLGLIDHWLTVVTGGKWEPDPEQPAGDRASNEISGGMGGLIESARLAPPLPTAAQERADAGLVSELSRAIHLIDHEDQAATREARDLLIRLKALLSAQPGTAGEAPSLDLAALRTRADTLAAEVGSG